VQYLSAKLFANAPKALVLDRQTVLTESFRTSRTSAGAERHAQFSVTPSPPDGFASPIGIRQLKMQESADATAGRAVTDYGGEVSDDDEALVDMSIVLIFPDKDVELEVEGVLKELPNARWIVHQKGAVDLPLAMKQSGRAWR
jgi:hypothetical protein